MTNSFYTQPIPENRKQFAALGYGSLGNVLSYKYPIMVEQAAAGIWTTPTDMCKFIIELQHSLLGKSNKILSKKNTELMLMPYIDARSAFVFFIDDNKGHKYFSHEAGNWGFSGAFYGSFENGNGVAIFINSENSDFIKEIGNSIIDVYDWAGFEKKEAKKIVEVADNILQKYVGIYQSENRKVEILKENGSYFYVIDKGKRKIYFTSNTKFVNMESPSVKSFEFDKNNVLKGFKLKYKENEIVFGKK